MTVDCHGEELNPNDRVFWHNGWGPNGTVMLCRGAYVHVETEQGHRQFSLAINWSKRPTGELERAEAVRKAREKERREQDDQQCTCEETCPVHGRNP